MSSEGGNWDSEILFGWEMRESLECLPDDLEVGRLGSNSMEIEGELNDGPF